MAIKRRDFLGSVAAGSAIITMPAFLVGCGIQSASTIAMRAPKNPFLEWFGVDQSIIVQLMSALTANGAEFADLYFQHSRSRSLTLEQGAISNASVNLQQGVGLRTVIGDKTGFAFTEDLSLPSMLTAATTAASIAQGGAIATPQQFNHLASGELYTNTINWTDVGEDRIPSLLTYVEQKVRARDELITDVSVHWEDSDERVMIANLAGDLVTDDRPMARMTVVAIARKGEVVQTGFANIARRADVSWFTQERLDGMIDEVVERTMIQFEAVRAPSGDMPVILSSGSSGILLHEAIGHGLEADLNRDGSSIYAGMIGEKIAESLVSIVDQADLPGERGALNYDDEGLQTRRNVLVKDGILESYLHDQISASHYNVLSTASGRRESYKYAPMPRMTCTFMEGGPHTKEEIVAAVDRGVICESYAGGQVQMGAGDFMFSVKNAWLVENGKIAAPLKDLSISGNGPQVLRKISMVADDPRLDAGGWTCGKKGQNVPVSQGTPTILVSEMAVSEQTGA